MSVVSFGMNSIRASEEDELVIKRLQSAAVMRDPNMAAANLVAAQSDAMRIAAGNANVPYKQMNEWLYPIAQTEQLTALSV